ncbi:MAG: hypothetical protein AAFY88_13700 [Acidobacteriota bacterium]
MTPVSTDPRPTPAAGDLAGRIALLGLCIDERSSFLRGPAEAPAKIREVLHNGSSHWTFDPQVRGVAVLDDAVA